jgi:hypothetical protein
VPNIPELYGGVSEGNLTTTDPCSNWSTCRHVRRVAELQGRRRSCWLQAAGQHHPDHGGRQPKLEPEDAKTMTAGVWSPTKTLTLTLDYYNIKITNAIQSVAGSTKLADLLQHARPGAHLLQPGQLHAQQAPPARSTSSSQPVNAADEKISGFDRRALRVQPGRPSRPRSAPRLSHLKNYQVRPFPGRRHRLHRQDHRWPRQLHAVAFAELADGGKGRGRVLHVAVHRRGR